MTFSQVRGRQGSLLGDVCWCDWHSWLLTCWDVIWEKLSWRLSTEVRSAYCKWDISLFWRAMVAFLLWISSYCKAMSVFLFWESRLFCWIKMFLTLIDSFSFEFFPFNSSFSSNSLLTYVSFMFNYICFCFTSPFESLNFSYKRTIYSYCFFIVFSLALLFSKVFCKSLSRFVTTFFKQSISVK